MKNDLNQELSEYLKFLRFRKKKSQENVADELNVSRNTYNTW